MHRVDIPLRQLLDDDFARVLLVVLVDFLGRQVARAGNCAVEVVRVGRAVAGNVLARLRPADRVGAVRVHDAADVRVLLVQLQMCFRVAGGVQFALDDVAVQVKHDQLVGGQLVVLHARRLDDDQPLFAADAGHVAPCIRHQMTLGQLHVGFVNGFFERFQHRNSPPQSISAIAAFSAESA